MSVRSELHLSVIGAGRVGQTLAALFARQGTVIIREVCNRTLASSQRAVDFIAKGRALGSISYLKPAHLWMIAVADSEISKVAQELSAYGVVRPGDVVFHTSGALSAEILAPLREKGAAVAGIHPIKSFAEPALALQTFPGTWCACEGDEAACEVLEKIFKAIGGEVFRLTPTAKELCHLGHVFASNYIVTVMDCAQQMYRLAGIPDEVSSKFMRPIVEGVVQNVLTLGTDRALTGPIVRGDTLTVQRHRQVLNERALELANLYDELAQGALRIAERVGLDEEHIRALRRTLNPHSA